MLKKVLSTPSTLPSLEYKALSLKAFPYTSFFHSIFNNEYNVISLLVSIMQIYNSVKHFHLPGILHLESIITHNQHHIRLSFTTGKAPQIECNKQNDTSE
jgi:hypothetical protein